MADPQGRMRILFIGVEEHCLNIVKRILPGAEYIEINTSEQFGAQFESWTDGQFNLIVAGAILDSIPANEIAQTLSSQCANTLRVFVTVDAKYYAARDLLKNGFEFAFLFPVDQNQLKKLIKERLLSKDQKVYRPIKIQDLKPGDSLPFELLVFLPLNRKHIKFSSANEVFTVEKIEKLKKHQMQMVYLDKVDMEKFYAYTASQLAAGGSETERQEKAKSTVRSLFSDIFDQSLKSEFDTGKEMIENCQGIISNFMTGGKSSNWFESLMNRIGEAEDVYDHASQVSTFAAMFGMGIGHSHPEDLAMAGLFHDIGLSQLPAELMDKTPYEIKPEEAEVYYTHPEKSVAILKNRRMVITPVVEKAILQHHESYTGKGFPKGLTAARIADEAQILRFADEFEYKMRVEPGKKRLSPLEAWEQIRQPNHINPDLMNKLKDLLSKK